MAFSYAHHMSSPLAHYIQATRLQSELSCARAINTITLTTCTRTMFLEKAVSDILALQMRALASVAGPWPIPAHVHACLGGQCLQ